MPWNELGCALNLERFTAVKRRARAHFPPKLLHTKSFRNFRKPKVKTVTEKLRFMRRLNIGNLIIVTEKSP